MFAHMHLSPCAPETPPAHSGAFASGDPGEGTEPLKSDSSGNLDSLNANEASAKAKTERNGERGMPGSAVPPKSIWQARAHEDSDWVAVEGGQQIGFFLPPVQLYHAELYSGVRYPSVLHLGGVAARGKSYPGLESKGGPGASPQISWAGGVD